jgi:hypothetical protein
MRGKKNLLLVVSLLFLFALTLSILPLTAAPPATYVKVYVYQPGGYLPFQPIDTKFTFYVYIETLGFSDGTTGGIIQWKMDMRVDPNVLNIDTTTSGFPPSYAAKFSAGPGHFLYEFANLMAYPAPSFFPGTNDPATGYQDEIAETGIPSYEFGAGDYMSGTYPKLMTVEITSKSNTQPCLIDLIDVMYRTGDLVWHYAEYVEDGYYGQPPTYLSSTAPFDPLDPVGSTWHELYPYYCNNLIMTSHTDNGDGVLSASDQVDFLNETDGYTYWYHVDAVTVTIHWTFKIDETTPTDPAELGDGEPYEPHEIPVEPGATEIPDILGTTWHQIYPDYCREFVITSHDDTDGDGALDPSEQFDFVYQDDETETPVWAHLDSITTDLILSFKEKEPPVPEFPLGIGLILAIVPIIPVIYLWRKREK